MQIKDNVFWVGVQDPTLRVFDIVMETAQGTSYNAYLVKGTHKTALIETVRVNFFEEYLQNIQAIVPLEEIDYLIINHSEPDHAGSVEKLLDLVPNLTVVASAIALVFLRDICNLSFKSKAVGQGAQLDLGDKTLHFINAPLLHWPDTIYTYLKEDKILFSCDSFGCHYASEKLFSDLIEEDFTPAYKFYFDSIMSPFMPYVRKAMQRLKNYEIDLICPGHGPLLRKDIEKYLGLYEKWSAPVLKINGRPKIVMVYVTAYGYTEMLADAIEEGIQAAGDFTLKRFNLIEASVEEVLAEIEKTEGLLIGSPTINKDTVPPIWELLSHVSAVSHMKTVASSFGAYGWSGEAVPNIEARLEMLRMNVLPGLQVKFKPTQEDLEQAKSFGMAFGRAVLNEALIIKKKPATDNKTAPALSPTDYPIQYATDDLIVYWKLDQCMHDTQCYLRHPHIFNPEARPWVKMDGNDPEEIIQAIDSCPSGALKYSIPAGSSLDRTLGNGPGSFSNRSK